MAELREIPKRAAYKAAEVCEIARIQPYVLRSWESEFPTLGTVRDGTRIYRRSDLAQVLRIRQLVFDQGLTLAGARRRLEADTEPQPELPLEEFVTPDMKQRIDCVKQGLQDLLAILGGGPTSPETRHADASAGAGEACAPAASADAATAPRKTSGGTRSQTGGGTRSKGNRQCAAVPAARRRVIK